MEVSIKTISENKVVSHIQYKICEILRKWGSLTRDQICDIFGFKRDKAFTTKPNDKRYNYLQHEKRTTIYDNLTTLINRGYVRKFSRQITKHGRPTVFFTLVDNNIELIDGSVYNVRNNI